MSEVKSVRIYKGLNGRQYIRAWYDVHQGATNSIPFAPEEGDLLGGDVIDLANCKKKEVKLWRAEREKLRKAFVFLDGNHERSSVLNESYTIGSTIFVHGDFELWGADKAIKYRTKPHGAGILKRGLWVNALEAIENGYDRKINDEDIKRIEDFAIKNKVKKYVCGHLHPQIALQLTSPNGIEIEICKRGLNKVEIVF